MITRWKTLFEKPLISSYGHSCLIPKSEVLMTDRNLRKTTLDASERRKQREEARHLLKAIKKCRAAYSDVIEETVAQLSGLEVITEDNSESVFLENDGDSSAEEYIDPLKAVISPETGILQRKDSFVQRPTPSPGEWSTVNTFFPEGCVISPRRPILSSTTMDPDTYNRRFVKFSLQLIVLIANILI